MMGTSSTLYKSETWLIKQYWGKKLSIRQIAKKYRCSKNTLKKYMDKFFIPRRAACAGRRLIFKQKPHWKKGFLMWLYQKHSATQLSELFQIDRKTVKYWLEKHGIKIRDYKEFRQLKYRQIPSHKISRTFYLLLERLKMGFNACRMAHENKDN